MRVKFAQKCKADNCNELNDSHGYCRKHWRRIERNGDPLIVKSRRVLTQCKAPGCQKDIHSNEYCKRHFAIWERNGLPYRFIASAITWARGAQGYRVGTVDGVQLFEHRYLAEKALGKSLPEGAEVHHMNEDKADNKSPLNLIICPDRAYHKLLEQRTREYELRQLMQDVCSDQTGQ